MDGSHRGLGHHHASGGWIVLAESLSRWQLLGFVFTISAITYGARLDSTTTRAGNHDPCDASHSGRRMLNSV